MRARTCHCRRSCLTWPSKTPCFPGHIVTLARRHDCRARFCESMCALRALQLLQILQFAVPQEVCLRDTCKASLFRNIHAGQLICSTATSATFGSETAHPGTTAKRMRQPGFRHRHQCWSNLSGLAVLFTVNLPADLLCQAKVQLQFGVRLIE